MSSKAKKPLRMQAPARSTASTPEVVEAARVSAHTALAVAKLQAAAARSGARLNAGAVVVTALSALVGVLLVQSSKDSTAPAVPHAPPSPAASAPHDYLLRDAERAAALAEVELFIEATYAMDCTLGSHATRANCQNAKAARLVKAHQERERILAGGK